MGSSNPGMRSATAGFYPGQYVADPWASIVAGTQQNQTPAGQAQPPLPLVPGTMAGKAPPRVPVNPNLPNPTNGRPSSPYAAFVEQALQPEPLSSVWNAWGKPGYVRRLASASSATAAMPETSDEHLYHTGIRPLDAGLNLASGAGGAEWQTAKDLGSLLYNVQPEGLITGLADAAGIAGNVPANAPDAWRSMRPVFDLGHALATHPAQVWEGAQQAAGNWWDSVSQGDPDKQMYAIGATAFNGGMTLAGLVDPELLAGKVGSLARVGETTEALEAARAAKVAKYVNQGFSPAKAEYLAEPYEGMGHHFIPRRGIDVPRSLSQLPFVPKTIKLPKVISDSRFNVLKPSGMSRGDFYELHYKVDPHYYGSGLPRGLGPGGWSGQRIGLEEYGPLGRLWYGSPTSLKLAVGGTAADAARGASWLANQQDQSGVTSNNALSSPLDDINDFPDLTSTPQDQVGPPTNAPSVLPASENGNLLRASVWPPWNSND